MPDQTKTYRLKAVASEQKAALATDPLIKREWEEIAMQWHLLANLAGLKFNTEIDVS
jgi:hypothetical protein